MLKSGSSTRNYPYPPTASSLEQTGSQRSGSLKGMLLSMEGSQQVLNSHYPTVYSNADLTENTIRLLPGLVLGMSTSGRLATVTHLNNERVQMVSCRKLERLTKAEKKLKKSKRLDRHGLSLDSRKQR